MNKYAYIAIPFLIFLCITNLISYNKGILVGIDEQKARQSDIDAKQVTVSMSTMAKQNNATVITQSAIATAVKERVIYKQRYVYVKATESCAQTCADIWNWGIK